MALTAPLPPGFDGDAMLGESMKRRRTSRAARPRADGSSGRRWLWVPAGLVIVAAAFGVGYLIAARVIYPPGEVAGEGIAVPRLIGMDATEASQTLAAVGLGRLVRTELPTTAAAPGRITAQDPLPGQQLREGAVVRVAVSSGAPHGLVPDVVGFPVERATRLLERLGFRVQEVLSESDATAGRVLGVEPAPGTDQPLPTLVTVVVSAGPPPPADTLAADTTGAFPADTASSMLRPMRDLESDR
jgi:serine/threonine-protein kinase